DGSFRNLQRNFNELYLQLGKKLKTDEVFKFYLDKSGSYSEVDFDEDLNKGEIKLILEKLEKMANDGIDFSSFRCKLMNYFQKKILAFYGVGEKNNNGIDLEDSEFLINLLVKASKQEKEMEIDQLPMELVVVEFISQKRSDISQKNKEETEVVKTSVTKVEEVKEEIKAEETLEEAIMLKEDCSLRMETVEKKWSSLLMTIKPFNHSVEAFLRATRPISIKNKKVILEVFYPFHKDRLEEEKNRKIVEDCMNKTYGINLCFECVLGKSKKGPLVIKNDTPMENVSDQLVEKKNNSSSDIYDVAKEIFG
ncbi:MAG: hypothetical protein WCX20_01870, partial [Candidatus Shapirobacteria bacterium]